MSDPSSDLLWVQPEWRSQADTWVQEQLSRLGIEGTGPIAEPHIRAWSTVWPIPTRAGRLYFKASSTYSAHETGVTAALSSWRPDCIPQVLASDQERRWMLMREGGQRLRSVLETGKEIGHWQRVLPLYAQLQMEMAGRTETLLAMGVPDHRLATLPDRYVQLLMDTEILRPGHPEGLSIDEHHRLSDFPPQFAALCERLSSYGIPETLQHDDLHDGNILVNEERYLFFDWGDCCLSHPFFTLIVTQRSIARTMDLPEDGPEICQVLDLYLDSWRSLLPRHALQAAFELAFRISMVCRALTWHRLVSNITGAWKEKYKGYVSAWLQEFLGTFG